MRFLSALALAMLIPHLACEAQTSFIGRYRRTTNATSGVTTESLDRDVSIPISLVGLPQVFPAGARIVVNGTLLGDQLKVTSAAYEKQIPKAVGLKRVQVLLAQFEGESFPFSTVGPLEESLSGTSDSVRTYFEQVSGNQLSYQFNRPSVLKLPARAKATNGLVKPVLLSEMQAQGYNPAAFDLTLVFAPTTPTPVLSSTTFADQKFGLIVTDLAQPTEVKRETKQRILRLHGLDNATLLRCVDPLGNVVPLSGTCTSNLAGDRYSALNDFMTSHHPNAWERITLGWTSAASIISPTTSGVYTIASRDRTFSGAIALKVPFGRAPVALSRWTGQEYELWLEFYDSEAEGGTLPAQKLLIPRIVPKHRGSEATYDKTTAVVFGGLNGATTQALQVGQSFTPPGTNITITPLGLVDGATPQAPKNYRVFVNIATTSSATKVTPPLVPVVTFGNTTITGEVGKKLSKITPTRTGGAITSCTATPKLPKGLQLRSPSCAITGRPTKASRLTTYTISAANSSGVQSTTIQLQVLKKTSGRGKRK